ncbi:hypothetical protein HPB47_012126, partial [Ixodes persulcatus]
EVSLADNVHSEYKSRELKSVLVDAIGDLVRFRIHANHVNKYNVYNQVGIVALNVIGDDVVLDGSGEDEKTTWQTIIKRNEEISPMDDLAFDMYVDTEVAQILRKLEAKKRDAIAEERFVFAKKLKYAVVELQKVGEKLGKMVIEKQMAVEMEDFDKARQKKQHIEEYRLNAYEHLRLPELMEMEGEIQAFQRRSAFIDLWSQIDGLARTSEVRSSFSLARAFFAGAIFFEWVSGIHASGFPSLVSPISYSSRQTHRASGPTPSQEA